MKRKNIFSLALGFFSAIAMAETYFDNAVYEVPVRAGLEAFAHFEIKDLQTQNTDRGVEFSYSLPAELTGIKDTKVAFIASTTDVNGKDFRLKGPKGEAACKFLSSSQVSCHIVYKNLGIDTPAAEALIHHNFSDPDEVAARVEVAHAFSSEPIGTIHYRCHRHH